VSREHYIAFAYIPSDYVTITLFDIRYKGRVVRVISESKDSYNGNGILYDVQYADDRGELKRGEFAEDELEAVKVPTTIPVPSPVDEEPF
jgi:hypothetical protein